VGLYEFHAQNGCECLTSHSTHINLLKKHQYILDTGLIGLQGKSGHCGQNRNLCHAGNQSPVIQPIGTHFPD
jgi:hypothetical protein